MRKNFNEFIGGGGKLTYEQIRNLNSVYKEDYVKAMLKEDDAMAEYVKISQGTLLDAFDQVEQMIEGLQDVDDEWQNNVKEINKKIMDSAIKNGITKGNLGKFKFKEFNIADMYRQ